MLKINTNIPSLQAQNSLNKLGNAQQTTLQQLSSGLRINSAKDNAAGLAIAARLLSQIDGGQQAIRNANDAVSLAQTAQGATQQVGDGLQRLRDLALQSANGSYSASDRAALQAEFSSVQSEIGRTIQTAQFNGQPVLTGSATRQFQVGANAGETLNVTGVDLASSNTGVGGVLENSVSISSQEGANNALGAIDSALQNLSSVQGNLGAQQNRLESTARNLATGVENQAAARSRITDTDYAQATAANIRQTLLAKAGLTAGVQANATPQLALSLLKG